MKFKGYGHPIPIVYWKDGVESVNGAITTMQIEQLGAQIQNNQDENH